MPRSELGTKRTDPETGKKFYDLGKDPIVSPYTGTSYPLSFFEAATAPSRHSKAAAEPVHREEPDETAEDQDEDADTVSLNDVEEEDGATSKGETIDVDDDEDDEKEDDDTFLTLDEDDDAEDVDDLVGERDEDDN